MTLQESPLETISHQNACQLYDEFLAGLIRVHQQQITPDLNQLSVVYLG